MTRLTGQDLGLELSPDQVPRFNLRAPLGILESVNVGTREDGAVELRFRLQAPLLDFFVQLNGEDARTLGKALTAPSVVVAANGQT